MVSIQCETVWARVSAAHSDFLAARQQIIISTKPLSTKLSGHVQFGHITKRARIGIAFSSLCAAFVNRRGGRIAVLFGAEDMSCRRLVHPVVWASVAEARTDQPAACVQVFM
jgi:hypothetical protein